MNERLETDDLVLGCGIAGATAALGLGWAGAQVTVVTRAQAAHESNTYYSPDCILCG